MPLALSFVTDVFDEANLTAYTFSSVDIGTAVSDRIVIVTANAEAGEPISTITIGGAATTIAVSEKASVSAAVIAYAAIPTGTSADIVVTWDSGAIRCMIGVWELTGADITPTDTDTSTSLPSTGESLTVNIPTNAAAVATHTSGDSSSSDFWTGAVRRYADATSGAELQGADVQPTGSDRPTHAISTSYTELANGAALVGAVWSEASTGFGGMLLLGVGS